MKYCECKQALYNSKAMESIPDQWREEVPIIFDGADGKKKLGFIFGLSGNGEWKLKKMIAVSIEDAGVVEYSLDQLQRYYQVSDQHLAAIRIKDYEVYFLEKEEYEALLASMVDDGFNKTCYLNKKKKRFLQLTHSMFSSEQYEKIICRIGREFYEYIDK